MLLMASSGFGFAEMAGRAPESRLLKFLATETEHASWAGCTLWDFIQPAFMFMVGVALPWSVANRLARGETFAKMFRHALARSVILILLAVFLTSAWSRQTEWVFTNVLAQIGLGYPFLFLLAFTRPRFQLTAAGLLLFFYWLAFAVYPAAPWPPNDPAWQNLGVPPDWLHLTGFAAHWEKNVNLASAFDRWFLNLFPREKPFFFSSGGYQTLNFIPSLATMIAGLLAGEFLRTDRAASAKAWGLILAGLAAIAFGGGLSLAGICPLVKRIWTPSWAVFSSGAVAILLAGFYFLIDVRGLRSWAFPFIVAGLNPIALYCMWQLMSGFVRENLKRHFGPEIFAIFGDSLVPFMERASVLFVFWLILFWLYRRKIFLRI
jgi:predicted acyltransferase